MHSYDLMNYLIWLNNVYLPYFSRNCNVLIGAAPDTRTPLLFTHLTDDARAALSYCAYHVHVGARRMMWNDVSSLRGYRDMGVYPSLVLH